MTSAASQPAPAPAASPPEQEGRAPSIRDAHPAHLPLPARAHAGRDPGRAVHLLRAASRIELHRHAQPQFRRRLRRSDRWHRRRAGAAAGACRDRPVGRSDLPVLPVGRVLAAYRRSSLRALRRPPDLAVDRDRARRRLRRRRDQRSDHGTAERALVRRHAGDELHPLRRGARRLTGRAGDPDPAERPVEHHQQHHGRRTVGRDPVGARGHGDPQLPAHADPLRHAPGRDRRQPARRGRGRRADPPRQGVRVHDLGILRRADRDRRRRQVRDARPGQRRASTTSSTPWAPA